MNQRNADLTGERFGRLTVIRPDEVNPRKWVCHCECGTIKSVRIDHLRSGATKTCGCGMAPPRRNLKDETFGRLTVLGPAPDGASGHSRWHCRCSCGQAVTTYTFALVSGKARSCGCLAQDTRRARRGEHRTDRTTYRTAHKRVEAVRGKASTHRCTDCDGPATDWSYDHADPDEMVQVVKGFALAYSAKVEHYQPRCLPCHRMYDCAPGWDGATQGV